MRLVKPKFEIIEQPSGIEGIYKIVEIAGRTCYKSENKITENSAKEFIQRMLRAGHLSVLEHGTVYLDLPNSARDFDSVGGYSANKYSKLRIVDKDDERIHNYVTTNLRVLIENGWFDDLRYICEPTEYHEKRYCVRFICDRGILAEFTRHRVFSFSAESTRYCNYSRDKFGNELTFILPQWMNEDPSNIDNNTYADIAVREYLRSAEKLYMGLVKGFPNIDDAVWKPQQARMILPNALKTELVMTGFVSDWKHFFKLRCDEAAHPQARELAIPLKEEFIKRNYIKD